MYSCFPLLFLASSLRAGKKRGLIFEPADAYRPRIEPHFLPSYGYHSDRILKFPEFSWVFSDKRKLSLTNWTILLTNPWVTNTWVRSTSHKWKVFLLLILKKAKTRWTISYSLEISLFPDFFQRCKFSCIRVKFSDFFPILNNLICFSNFFPTCESKVFLSVSCKFILLFKCHAINKLTLAVPDVTSSKHLSHTLTGFLLDVSGALFAVQSLQ